MFDINYLFNFMNFAYTCNAYILCVCSHADPDSELDGSDGDDGQGQPSAQELVQLQSVSNLRKSTVVGKKKTKAARETAGMNFIKL